MKIQVQAEDKHARGRFRMLATIAARLALLLMLPTVAAFAQIGASAETSSRPSPVEAINPKPPTPVVIDQKRVLVYELHITNFGQNALLFRRIEIFTAEGERA